MGMDVYGKLIVGVPISRSDFFITEKDRWMCENGHARPHDKAQFCEADGKKFVRKPIETPTPAFATWAKEEDQDADPHLFWDYLSDTYNDSGEVGIFCVDSVSGGYGGEDLALGFCVAHTNTHRDGRGDPVGVSPELVAAKAALVEKLAHELGIDRKAQVFLNVHVSC